MLTEKVLRETGLMEHFDVICAGNDLPTSKPHPDNMKVCIDGLQSAVSETLIVGDSRVDQRLAELSGVDFAFFSRGYDDGVNLTSKTPVIHHHHEVLNLI
jgi:phosphoglycolate phosphatase